MLAPVVAGPAAAGIFFNKKADKPNPTVVVPGLIRAIQSDGDEDKRVAAAEQLREFDPAQFPDVVPTLIEALQSDRKPSVRAEAALSLGKIRPVSDNVGVALEQALAKDSSMRVRLQARSVLLQYRWSGWKEPVVKKDETPTARPQGAPAAQSKEPPLAAPASKAPPLAQTSDRNYPKPASPPRALQAPASVPVATPSPVVEVP
ncbi:MAG TPA: HEAT repeat domain-containing protein, partial [Candidatus Binataceae bacterium]